MGLLHLHQEAGLQLVDVLCSAVCFVTKGLSMEKSLLETFNLEAIHTLYKSVVGRRGG